MGEAKRRRQRGEQADPGVKISRRTREAGLLLAHRERLEVEQDGWVLAQNVFHVLTPDGRTVVEETPDGPQPVEIISAPQRVRRALLAVVR